MPQETVIIHVTMDRTVIKLEEKAVVNRRGVEGKRETKKKKRKSSNLDAGAGIQSRLRQNSKHSEAGQVEISSFMLCLMFNQRSSRPFTSLMGSKQLCIVFAV